MSKTKPPSLCLSSQMAGSSNVLHNASARIQDYEYLYASNTNVSSFVSVKLSGSCNYLLWKAQMLCLLDSNNMGGIVDSTFVAPRYSGTEIMRQYDSLVRGWIFGSVTEDVLVDIFSLGSAKAVWDKLKSIHDPTVCLQEVKHIKNMEWSILPVRFPDNLWDEIDKLEDSVNNHRCNTMPKLYCERIVKVEQSMKNNAESFSITAALMTAILFAAGIIVQDVCSKELELTIKVKTLLFIFVISNAISLFASNMALVVFLSILTSGFAEKEFLLGLPRRLFTGLCSFFLCIAAMIVSFSASLFLVFCDQKPWKLVLIRGLLFVAIAFFVVVQFTFMVDLFKSTYLRIFGKQRKKHVVRDFKLFENSREVTIKRDWSEVESMLRKERQLVTEPVNSDGCTVLQLAAKTGTELGSLSNHLLSDSAQIQDIKYLFWKAQMICLLQSNNMCGIVDSTFVGPRDPVTKTMRQYNSLVKGLVLGSVTEGVPAEVFTFGFTKTVWEKLESVCDPTPCLQTEVETKIVDIQSNVNNIEQNKKVLEVTVKREVTWILNQWPEMMVAESGNLETALHEACRKAEVDMMKDLIAVDEGLVGKVNCKGKNVLFVACARRRGHLVTRLKEFQWYLVHHELDAFTILYVVAEVNSSYEAEAKEAITDSFDDKDHRNLTNILNKRMGLENKNFWSEENFVNMEPSNPHELQKIYAIKGKRWEMIASHAKISVIENVVSETFKVTSKGTVKIPLRLRRKNIQTVMNFLHTHSSNPLELQEICGIIAKRWEMTVKDAKRSLLGNMHIESTSQQQLKKTLSSDDHLEFDNGYSSQPCEDSHFNIPMVEDSKFSTQEFEVCVAYFMEDDSGNLVNDDAKDSDHVDDDSDHANGNNNADDQMVNDDARIYDSSCALKEAMLDPFEGKDHCNLHKCLGLLSLEDKGGKMINIPDKVMSNYRTRAESENISTVMNFHDMHSSNTLEPQEICGIKGKKWEMTVNHAKTSLIGNMCTKSTSHQQWGNTLASDGYADSIEFANSYNSQRCERQAIQAISNHGGGTILHMAVGIGSNHFVRKSPLYRNDEHVLENRNSDGSTVLHIAGIVGNKHAAELLVKKNNLLRIEDHEGKEPLHKAYEYMHLDTIGYLLKSVMSNDVGERELHSMLKKDEGLVAEPISDDDGSTALHLMVRIGHNHLLKKFMPYVNDEQVLQQRDYDGSTALHIAGIVVNNHAAKLLCLKNNNLMRIEDHESKEPLHKAYENMRFDTIGYLLKAVNGDAKTELQCSLHVSVHPDVEIVVRFISAIAAKQYALRLMRNIPEFASESYNPLMAIAKSVLSGDNPEEHKICGIKGKKSVMTVNQGKTSLIGNVGTESTSQQSNNSASAEYDGSTDLCIKILQPNDHFSIPMVEVSKFSASRVAYFIVFEPCQANEVGRMNGTWALASNNLEMNRFYAKTVVMKLPLDLSEVESLLRNDGNSPIHFAARKDHKYLLKKSYMYINEGHVYEKRNSDGGTALLIASVVGKKHATELSVFQLDAVLRSNTFCESGGLKLDRCKAGVPCMQFTNLQKESETKNADTQNSENKIEQKKKPLEVTLKWEWLVVECILKIQKLTPMGIIMGKDSSENKAAEIM